jgi:hypothetical protein
MSESTLHRPHRGALILVLGILGIIVCFPFGVAAWLMGQSDLRDMDQGVMDPTGRGLTDAGRILGIIGTILAAVGLIIAFISMLMMVPIVLLSN